MAIALVQALPTGSNPIPQEQATASATIAITPTTGNLLVVVVTGDTTALPDITSIADNKNAGNYAIASDALTAGAAGRAIIGYKASVVGALTTITVTFPSAFDGWGVAVFEISGYSTGTPLAGTNSGTGTSTGPASGSVTPSGNALYLGLFTTDNQNVVTITPAGSWTERFTDVTDTHCLMGCETIIGSGAKSATWTLDASHPWVAVLAVFNEAVASTAPSHPAHGYGSN